MAETGAVNPFNITKANDLTDPEVESLWVDVRGEDSDAALIASVKPASPMPMFVLGGKGSGKTHLLRYCSYTIQKIRYAKTGLGLLEGIQRDRYIGLYSQCGDLNPGRFAGKRQDEEVWREVFAYCVELWLAQQALAVGKQLVADAGLTPQAERALCANIRDLFDKMPAQAATVADCLIQVRQLQRNLDYLVGNAIFSGELPVDVQATRGRLMFGIPAALAKAIPALRGVNFVYQLDQFEDLTLSQQQHINTLVRERRAPATFKVGGRQFGIKTHATFSDGEVNLKDSEYEELRLDERLRNSGTLYKELAKRLAGRRLSQASAGDAGEDRANLAAWFDQPDIRWNSDYFREISPEDVVQERAHFLRLIDQLHAAMPVGLAPQTRSERTLRRIVEALSVPDFPLLEKVNLLLFYQDWARRRPLLDAATRIACQCAAFLAEPEAKSQYRTKLGHFKADLMAQMLRENREKQVYAGVGTFVRMSEGLPRAFITLLKQTYDWSALQREQPFVTGRISLEAQRRGAIAGSDWFYNSMTKAGADGPKILGAVDRLGQLFRLHRFSDKPIESSLIGFSVKERDASHEARQILQVATSRSFLVDIFGGQRDRNSADTTTKLQLNRMLAPRWDLPTARRGIVPLSSQAIDAIFCQDQGRAFEALKREWDAKLNAPFRPAGKRSGDDEAATRSGGQPVFL